MFALRRWWLGVVLLAGVGAWAEAKDPPKKRPEWPTIAAHLESSAAKQLPRRQANDLISRTEVKRLLETLDRVGWKPSDESKVVATALNDAHIMITLRKSPRGLAFLRQVGAQPQGFDRLEHLSRLGDGPDMIRRLADEPDGYKLIEYMATTSGGAALGEQLSESPGGAGFNRATGTIYTFEQLLKRLEQSYQAAAPSPRKSTKSRVNYRAGRSCPSAA